MAFDIRDALLGRTYPEASTAIWVDDRIFYEIDEIQHQIEDAIKAVSDNTNRTGTILDPDDDPTVKKLRSKLNTARKTRDKQAYTAHFRSFDNDVNEEIIDSALQEFPVERDMLGRERELNTLRRNRHIRELSLAMHLTKLTNPAGESQIIDDENRRDVARAILAKAPPVTLTIIDQSIAQINRSFADNLAKEQSTDFLSKR